MMAPMMLSLWNNVLTAHVRDVCMVMTNTFTKEEDYTSSFTYYGGLKMKKNYKLSNYNHFFSDGNDDYIYNFFSGGMSKLLPCEKKRLEDFDGSNEELDDFFKAAIDNGFIIKSDTDELQILNYLRTNTICTSKKVMYEILPTTACNARCSYCFEEGICPKTMTLETADAVADFIISRSTDNNSILIQWFGGEPLLNPEAITHITKKLDTVLTPKNVKLTYKMTTNGSLINDEIVEKFKNVWHISRVQITLDGLKEEYEKRKAYINLPNAFEHVINNINKLANNDIMVSIRLNYDLENIQDILKLIDYLGTVIEKKEKVICYAYPLFEVGSTKAPEDRDVALKLIEINNSIIRNGLAHSKEPFHLLLSATKCYSCLRNSFLINPEGKLGKCSMAMEDENFFGDVFSPSFRLTNEYLKWCSTELPSEECKTCKFLPVCQGGCKAGHLGYSPVKHYIYKNCIDEILLEIMKANS